MVSRKKTEIPTPRWERSPRIHLYTRKESIVSVERVSPTRQGVDIKSPKFN